MKSTKTYLFSYFYNGSNWSIEIIANSVEDAWAKLRSMQNATYDGELMMTINVPSVN